MSHPGITVLRVSHPGIYRRCPYTTRAYTTGAHTPPGYTGRETPTRVYRKGDTYPGMGTGYTHPGMGTGYTHPGIARDGRHLPGYSSGWETPTRVCTTRVYHPGMYHQVYHRVYTLLYTPGYTMVYTLPPLMHAATQWSEQCRQLEPWAQPLG